jgi:hypothetical protein
VFQLIVSFFCLTTCFGSRKGTRSFSTASKNRKKGLEIFEKSFRIFKKEEKKSSDLPILFTAVSLMNFSRKKLLKILVDRITCILNGFVFEKSKS